MVLWTREKSTSPHPLMPVIGERMIPEVTRAKELALTLTS